MIYFCARDFRRKVGAAQSARNVATALAASGEPLTVLSHGRCKLPDAMTGSRATPIRWLTPPRTMPDYRSLEGTLSPAANADWMTHALLNAFRGMRLQRALRRDRPRLSIFNEVPKRDSSLPECLGSLGAMALIIRAAPECYSYYQNNSGTSVEFALGKMRMFDYLVFVSSLCRDEWLQFEQLQQRPSFHIPNCCHEDVVAGTRSQSREQLRQRLRIPPSAFALVCVGNPQPRKGQDLVIEALPELAAIAPELELFFIGASNVPGNIAWLEALQRQIAGMGLGKKVHFLGHRSTAETMEYIHAGDALVLPSRSEALPRVILEAMALGTPVMASDAGGIPELIGHGEHGVLFARDSRDELIAAFARLHCNTAERALFAERAHARYWAEFSQQRQSERWREALDIMLAGGRVPPTLATA